MTRESRSENEPSDEQLFAPSGRLARGEDRRLLAEALLNLPLDMRIVLELAYWEQLDAPALAAVLGLPVNTARGRLQRAKRALGAALQRVRVTPGARD